MFPTIRPCRLPDNALLASYAGRGCYTDCFAAEVGRPVTHEQFVTAFYTTAVFKLERLILKWAASRPSTDDQARQLVAAERDDFAAWRVERRSERQLLLSDFRGRTKSWLMVLPLEDGSSSTTRLYFGSAVVPNERPRTNEPSLGLAFRALLGAHRFYSRVLLHAAKSRLLAQAG